MREWNRTGTEPDPREDRKNGSTVLTSSTKIEPRVELELNHVKTGPQLLSILRNPKMMFGNNLVLDPNNPLAMYKPPDGKLGEELSGVVYQDMYHHHVTNPSKQLLCPLICYTDSTQIDSLSQFSLEPFLFTPTLLTHAACNNANV